MGNYSVRICGGLTVLAILLLTGCAEQRQAKFAYRGLKSLERGDFAKAVTFLERAVKAPLAPERAALLQNHLGIALARDNRHAEAVKALETAHRLAPQMPEPPYNLGVLLLDKGQTDAAVAWFEKSVDNSTDDTRALEFLSAINRRKGDWNKARGYLMEAQRRQPRNPAIMTALASVESQAGNQEQAARLLQQCIEQDPRYPPAIFNLALVRRRQGNYIQARSLFHEYTRLEGVKQVPLTLARRNLDELNDLIAGTEEAPAETAAPPPATPSVQRTPRDLINTAQMLAQMGRAEAAVNNYLLAARIAQRAGQQNLSREAVEAAAKACGEDAHAHHNMGMYFLETNETAKALQHFKQAAMLAPEWFDAHIALARVALEQNEFDAALVSLRTAVRLRPDDANALWSLIQVFDRSLKLTGPAQTHYALFLQRFPEDVRARTARQRLAELRR